MEMVKFKPFVTIREGNDNYLIISNYKKDIYLKCNELDKEIIKSIIKGGVSKSDFLKFRFSSLLIEKNVIYYCGEGDGYPQHLLRTNLFFDYLNLDTISEEKKEENILIIGAGGGGGTLAYLLAQQGFQNIFCIDHDIVEYSDVEKTMVYRINNVGKLKVKELRNILYENFHTNVVDISVKISEKDILLNLIDTTKPKFIVSAIDPNPSYKLWLNDICLEKNIPYIFVAYSYNYIMVGPFIIPSVTSCFNSYAQFVINESNGIIDLSKMNRFTSPEMIHPSISFIINTMSSFALKDPKCLDCFSLPICGGGCPHKRIENKFNNRCFDNCTLFNNNFDDYLIEKIKLYESGK